MGFFCLLWLPFCVFWDNLLQKNLTARAFSLVLPWDPADCQDTLGCLLVVSMGHVFSMASWFSLKAAHLGC